MLLMDGVVRAMYRNATAKPLHLEPDQVCQVQIHLADIHHTFPAGSRLQVEVTSSGNEILANDTETDIHIATNVVRHSEERPSFIEVPLLST